MKTLVPTFPDTSDRRPYPKTWETVAELRVFRTTTPKWESLIGWRGDMRRKGWKLLKVGTERGEIIAVFGRTRSELKNRDEAPN